MTELSVNQKTFIKRMSEDEEYERRGFELLLRNYGGRDALMTTGSGHYYTALVERAETKPPTRRPVRGRRSTA
jgi:hypothetical protein